MHHAVHQPLGVNFRLGAKRKCAHAFMRAPICKNGFDNGDAFAVGLATAERIDFFAHALGEGGFFGVGHGDVLTKETHLSRWGDVGFTLIVWLT